MIVFLIVGDVIGGMVWMSMYCCWCWGCCFGADRDCSHHMMVRDEMSHFHLRQPCRHQREGVVCAMQKTLPKKGCCRGLYVFGLSEAVSVSALLLLLLQVGCSGG